MQILPIFDLLFIPYRDFIEKNYKQIQYSQIHLSFPLCLVLFES